MKSPFFIVFYSFAAAWLLVPVKASELPREGTYYPKGLSGPALPIPELSAAVGKGDTETVKALLDKGANPNRRMPEGTAPLHQAMYKDPAICRLLLEHHANPNIVIGAGPKGYSNNWTPIFFAISLRKPELITELLKYGADVDRRDSTGKSALELALETNDPKVISLVQDALKAKRHE